MKFFTPELPLKGERRYLHGTTILEYAIEIVNHHIPSACGGQLRAIFYDFAKSSLTVALASDNEASLRPNGLKAEVISQGKSGDRVFVWFTESGLPIKGQEPYPEESLMPILSFTNQKVSLKGIPILSPVETLVAMTKFAHQKFMPEFEGWFLTRLDIEHPLRNEDMEGLSVELQCHLGTLSRSIIYNSNGKIGMIYFSAI